MTPSRVKMSPCFLHELQIGEAIESREGHERQRHVVFLPAITCHLQARLEISPRLIGFAELRTRIPSDALEKRDAHAAFTGGSRRLEGGRCEVECGLGILHQHVALGDPSVGPRKLLASTRLRKPGPRFLELGERFLESSGPGCHPGQHFKTVGEHDPVAGGSPHTQRFPQGRLRLIEVALFAQDLRDVVSGERRHHRVTDLESALLRPFV